MWIGSRRMAITASISRADGQSLTAPAELWFGPTRPIEGPIIRALKFGASCPAAWARGAGSGPRPLAYVIEFNNRGPRRTRSNRSGVTLMLAEKYMLLLETLRKGLPDRSQAHKDGGPRV